MDIGHLAGLFEVGYESEGDQKFLYVEIDNHGEIQLYDYQFEMLLNNPCRYIAPMELRRKDDKVRIYYNISAHIPLKNHISNRAISIRELTHILSSIVGTVMQSKNMLLYESCFVLEEEFIFINIHDKSVLMIYLPVKSSLDIDKGIRDLTVKLATRTSVTNGENDNGILYNLINCVKSENFNINKLYQLLYGSKAWPGPASDAFNENFHTTGSEDSPASLQTNHLKRQNNTVLTDNRPTMDTAAKSGILHDILASRVKHIILFQSVIFFIAFIAELLLKTTGIQADTRYITIGMIAVVGNLLFFKYLTSAKAPGKDNSRQSAKVKKQHKAKVKKPHEAHYKRPEICGKQHNDNTNVQGIKAGDMGIQDLNQKSPATFEETTLLYRNKPGCACLIREKDGIQSITDITGPNFLIGRNPSISDLVIHEKSVGRVHAEIIQRDNEYYVIDKHSKNGTYLNEVKLTGGIEYKLNNNDMLVFANQEFKFVVRQGDMHPG